MPNLYKAPRFKCTGCGKCCTGNPTTHYIELTDGESEKIRRGLGISQPWFTRRYLTQLDDTAYGIKIDQNRNCVFLDKKKGCKIYETRPQQCSSYPYWPEILHSRTSWNKEAKRCEGIGRGNLVQKKYRKNIG